VLLRLGRESPAWSLSPIGPGFVHDDHQDSIYPCRDVRLVRRGLRSTRYTQHRCQAEARKTSSADGMQTRRNCQRDQALGRRLCGGLTTSGYHVPGGDHRTAYPRNRSSPSCKTIELSPAVCPPHTHPAMNRSHSSSGCTETHGDSFALRSYPV